jgi:hypothetical protein
MLAEPSVLSVRCDGSAIVLPCVAALVVLGANRPNVATACSVRLIAVVGIRVFTIPYI